jgi:hypothetical protein
VDEWVFEDLNESLAGPLENLAAGGYESISTSEMLGEFVANTSMLSPSERTNLVATAMAGESLGAGDYTQLAGLGLNLIGSIVQAAAPNNRNAQIAGAALRTGAK